MNNGIVPGAFQFEYW